MSEPTNLPLPDLDKLHAEAKRETISDRLSREAGPVSAEEARDALGRFNTSHWNTKGEKARYSIPANPRRDDDIRLGAFIDQSEKRITLLEETLRGILQEKQKQVAMLREELGDRGPNRGEAYAVAARELDQQITWLESVLGGGK